MNCIICASPAASQVRDIPSPFIEKSYHLYFCRECNSHFFDINQHPVDLGKVYADHAAEIAPIYAREFAPSAYWANQVKVISRLSGIPVNSVLDIGCRTGDFLMHWPATVRRCGVELSEQVANVARQRGLEIKRGFLEEIDFDGTFDAVSCYAVIEHLAEPLRFLERLPDLVSEDGLLVIMVPTRQCLKEKLVSAAGVRWHMYSPPQHLNFMSRGHLDSVLRQLGFRLVRRVYTSGGLFNPIRFVPFIGKTFDRLMLGHDLYSPLNRLPLFDHMYGYYRRERT